MQDYTRENEELSESGSSSDEEDELLLITPLAWKKTQGGIDHAYSKTVAEPKLEQPCTPGRCTPGRWSSEGQWSLGGTHRTNVVDERWKRAASDIEFLASSRPQKSAQTAYRRSFERGLERTCKYADKQVASWMRRENEEQMTKNFKTIKTYFESRSELQERSAKLQGMIVGPGQVLDPVLAELHRETSYEEYSFKTNIRRASLVRRAYAEGLIDADAFLKAFDLSADEGCESGNSDDEAAGQPDSRLRRGGAKKLTLNALTSVMGHEGGDIEIGESGGMPALPAVSRLPLQEREKNDERTPTGGISGADFHVPPVKADVESAIPAWLTSKKSRQTKNKPKLPQLT